LRGRCGPRVPGERATGGVHRGLGDRRARFVHVSADHFFSGDAASAHDERAPVRLVNEYARTKFAAEGLALAAPGALVLRTNVTGFRGWKGQPTFAEWAIDAIESRAPLTLFDDYYTSTLDSETLARATFDLIERDAAGLLNVASSQVASKLEFMHELARALGTPLPSFQRGSVRTLRTRRAESLGLDVRRAEAILQRPLPSLREVCDALVALRGE
jgi:dTDP-4-dehydrorhamnose reductase